MGPRLYDLRFLARPSDGHSPLESDEPLIDDAVAAKGTTLVDSALASLRVATHDAQADRGEVTLDGNDRRA